MRAGAKRKGAQGIFARSALLFFVAVCAWHALPDASPVAGQVASQVASQKESAFSKWSPNHDIPNAHYVGSAACAQCHKNRVSVQKASAMGRALEATADCQILRSHPKLTFRNGVYSYQILRDGDRTVYTVSDGTKSISEPVLWAFGQGVAGQTYVFKHNGEYVESRVSFFNDVQALDITIGHDPAPQRSLEDAAGRVMKQDEARDCFACHTTAAISGNRLQAEHLIPGVSCEQCHGPGDRHLAAMKSGDLDDKNIFNPRTLGTEELSNFCGSCHRTWEKVAMMGLRGVNNVRFQPYRLANSKCYDADDRRISCVACHNPHENVNRDPSFYDSKCTACHSPQTKGVAAPERTAAICPVGKERCTRCHMPKYDLPGGHFKFTDHHIRLVRQGDQYPN
jgi:hypothetical protein